MILLLAHKGIFKASKRKNNNVSNRERIMAPDAFNILDGEIIIAQRRLAGSQTDTPSRAS